MTIVLHYFQCRSRGQALRFALVGGGVDFEDRRVPVEAVEKWRENARTGTRDVPFASLPVLEWGGYRVAQTLAIASYLSAKLGFAEHLENAEEQARDAMIVSAAHLDMQVPYSRLMWLSGDAADAQVEAVARGLFGTLEQKLRQLEALHETASRPGAYFGGLRPTMADYFVYESIDRGCAVFGAPFEALLATTERMARLRHMLATDPEITAYVRAGGVPTNVTASPTEGTIRARLGALRGAL